MLQALWWAYFRGSLSSEGRIIGRNFAFQNGLGLTIKEALNTKVALGGGGGGGGEEGLIIVIFTSKSTFAF